MKRLVIDARESGTSTGRYIDKLVEHLHKIKPGFEIILLAKSPRINYLKNIAPSFKVLKSDHKEFTFAEQLVLLRQINKLNPDLVHFAMVQQPVLYRGTVVTTMHDLTTTRFRNPTKNWLVFTFKQTVYRWLNKRVARKSQAIFANSKFTKNDIIEFAKISGDKITVTYMAADKINDQAVPVPQLIDQQFIMYVGRAHPHKNLYKLLQAFSLLKESHPQLRLVLAGKKDVMYKKLETWAKDKKINNVFFTDFVSEGQLRWLYENTSVYVFPSLAEGFGMPGLEAMAHGAPVASSNATCLPEIYGNAAEYFDPKSTKSISGAILNVLDNPQRAKQLKKLGFNQVKKYSWQGTARQTLKIYTDILNE